jgi:hypothetical protein
VTAAPPRRKAEIATRLPLGTAGDAEMATSPPHHEREVFRAL